MTSVSSLFSTRRTQRHGWQEEKSSLRKKKMATGGTAQPLAATERCAFIADC